MDTPTVVLIHDTPLGKYQIGIWNDDNPQDPRDNDNLGTMACWHRGYELGDEQIRDVEEWLISMAGVESNELYERMTARSLWESLSEKINEKYIIMPLFLYEHSGMTMSTSPFSCKWDSGQVGFIYYDRSRNDTEGYTAEWLAKYHEGKSMDEAIESRLESEVELYASYLEGDVYGYEIFRPGKEVELGNGEDSTWGFFGYNEWENNGLLDDAIPAIEQDVKERLEKKQSQLRNHYRDMKWWIRNKLPLHYRKPLKLQY